MPANILVAWVIAFALCIVLAFVVVDDLRRFRIRNGAVLALAGLSVASCVSKGGWPLLVTHLAFSALILAVMAGAFALGGLGGGDAKLMAVAALSVGPERSLPFAIALLGATLVCVVGAKLGALPVRNLMGRQAIPFGPSIAAAWLIALGMDGLP